MQKTLLALLAVSFVLTSCFKDEPLGSECDIETAWVHVLSVEEVFDQATDTLKEVRSNTVAIVFDVKDNTVDLSAMAPQFTLSPGATVSPASGTTFDFSDGQTHSYTVTSEDGQWTRTYTVSFRAKDMVDKYSFENCELLDDGYYAWTDLDAAGQPLDNWSTANAGFKIARSTAKPEEFPTVPCEGYKGKGLKLETCNTGPFGVMSKRRLAAGNIFIGEFDLSLALKNTLHSTRFGLPFKQEPLELSGWYRYLPGPTVQDKDGKPMPDEKDAGTIYAIFYRNHDAEGTPVVLYGDDIQTSEQIVAKAIMRVDERVEDWTHFAVSFTYLDAIDPALLATSGYSLTVVGSSSVNGDFYQGAIGSQLYIDELQVKCKKDEE